MTTILEAGGAGTAPDSISARAAVPHHETPEIQLPAAGDGHTSVLAEHDLCDTRGNFSREANDYKYCASELVFSRPMSAQISPRPF